jgi:hypothetical protein
VWLEQLLQVVTAAQELHLLCLEHLLLTQAAEAEALIKAEPLALVALEVEVRQEQQEPIAMDLLVQLTLEAVAVVVLFKQILATGLAVTAALAS